MMNGFYIVMGEFGSGKTQNSTKYLKDANKSKEINIANYYTGYNDFQIQSHEDLINILNDIYDYHLYNNLYDDREELFTFKPHLLPEYEENAKKFKERFGDLKKGLHFNLNLDESSIYFNPRNFAKNFSGKNERLLDFVYQPRKLNCLFNIIVQSPLELDVKFRRLASYYRKYYKGFRLIRWHKDFYFPNPEEMDFEKRDVVGWGINFNFYPWFPRYKYNTKELIILGDNIYQKGAIIDFISKNFKYATKTPKKELESIEITPETTQTILQTA